MKKIGIVVIIIGAIAASLIALSTSVNRINYAAARTVNFTEEEVPISKTSLANFDVKNISTNVPRSNTIFDIRKDPFSDYILQLGYDEVSKTYKLYFLKRASAESKSIIPVKSIVLKKRKMRLIAGGKILTDKDNIYVGIEDALFTINRKTMSVKSVKLPAVRFKISENLVPDEEFVQNNYIIDMAKLDNEITISQNCATSILFYDIKTGKFRTVKLPESFGTVNHLLALQDRNILFVTNFYSGDKNFTINNKFGYLNLKTNAFNILNLPVSYLFTVSGAVYGMSPVKGLIKLDENSSKVEFTPLSRLHILSPLVPSKDKLWFVGSDIDTKNLLDETLPVNNTVTYYSDKLTKPVEYIGLYSFKDRSLKKYYLPLISMGPAYGGYSVNTQKAPEKALKGIELIKQIIPQENGSVILLKGTGKALEVNP